MSSIISDPELLPKEIDLSRLPASRQERLDQLTQLYAASLPAVQTFVAAMSLLHDSSITVLSPVTKEIFARSSREGQLLGDEFLQVFHLRTAYLVEESRRLREIFERNHRAAYTIAKII